MVHLLVKQLHGYECARLFYEYVWARQPRWCRCYTAAKEDSPSSLSYLWTYNLQTNLLYMTNAYVSDQVSYDALEQTLMLPDASHTRLLPISRRPMVTDTTSLALVNGMLQSRQDVRPSEAFGWLGLPKTIITAIVPFFGSASGGGSGQGSGGGNQSSGTGGQGGQGTQNGQGGQAAQGGQAGGNQSNISTQPVSPPIQ